MITPDLLNAHEQMHERLALRGVDGNMRAMSTACPGEIKPAPRPIPVTYTVCAKSSGATDAAVERSRLGLLALFSTP